MAAKDIDASVSCHRVTMQVKIIVRTVLSRAKKRDLVKETQQKITRKINLKYFQVSNFVNER